MTPLFMDIVPQERDMSQILGAIMMVKVCKLILSTPVFYMVAADVLPTVL